MNRHPSQTELANEVAAVRFALIDLGMYLDTHPDCEGALRLFCEYNRKYQELFSVYASHFGPLRMTDVCGGCGGGWSWGDADMVGEGGH